MFAQGSYRNRTNVRAESDVDVCVYCPDPFFFDLPPGGTAAQFQILVPAAYTFDQYRADVGAALLAHFGARSVQAGRKAFDVHESTNRIAADAVATMEYRRYQYGAQPALGTGFLCAGQRIINYPEQHYANGVTKNDATARRFKAVTRIIKRLRYEMVGADVGDAQNVQSFEIESMGWNVPNPLFGALTFREDLMAIVAHIYAKTENDQSCGDWTEVNGIKPLFGPEQFWSRANVRPFLESAWVFAELGQ